MAEKKRFFNSVWGWVIILSVAVLTAEAAVLLISTSIHEEQMVKTENNFKFIEGTWETEDYTSLSGVHCIKKMDTFNGKGAINETLYLDDGSKINFKGILTYSSPDSFDVYYSSFIFSVNVNGNTAMMSSYEYGINGLRFEQIEGGGNITGVWRNIEQYTFYEGYDYVELSVYENNTALLNIISNASGNKVPVKMEYSMLGKNSYVFSISDSISMINIGNNNLYDNFGHVYTRVE